MHDRNCLAAPGKGRPTRRAVLAALPAVGFAPAAAPAGPPPGDTPILRLFRRRNALSEAARLHPSVDDDELERLFYREADELEAELMASPCTCAADFAAKLLTDTCAGEVWTWGPDNLLVVEARELVGEAA